MANWKYNLKLKDLRDKCDAGEITESELGKKIAERIKASQMFKNMKEDDGNYEHLDSIIYGFEHVTDQQDFNNVLEELYNFGDMEVEPFDQWPRNKMCWIGFAF